MVREASVYLKRLHVLHLCGRLDRIYVIDLVEVPLKVSVLVLCLTTADLLTVLCGLVGGLVLELGHMTWAGTATGE